MQPVICFLCFSMILLGACTKENGMIPRNTSAVQFLDGFETIENDLSNLFPTDNSRWSNFQLVHPNNGRNQVGLSKNTFSEQTQSLYILAQASDDILSKAAIEKGGFSARVGDTLTIEADFYIASTANLENLLLVDLECCACWDSKVPDNQCPGVRLMMKDNDHLTMERGKILGSTINQSEFPFPRNEWVNIRWQLKLSPDEDGFNQLWINNQSVISESGMNMPNAQRFREEAARNNFDFQLQDPLFTNDFKLV